MAPSPAAIVLSENSAAIKKFSRGYALSQGDRGIAVPNPAAFQAGSEARRHSPDLPAHSLPPPLRPRNFYKPAFDKPRRRPTVMTAAATGARVFSRPREDRPR